jgi:hypothetical protein
MKRDQIVRINLVFTYLTWLAAVVARGLPMPSAVTTISGLEVHIHDAHASNANPRYRPFSMSCHRVPNSARPAPRPSQLQYLIVRRERNMFSFCPPKVVVAVVVALSGMFAEPVTQAQESGRRPAQSSPNRAAPQPTRGDGGGVHYHQHFYGVAAGSPTGFFPPAHAYAGYDASGITNPAAARGQYNLSTAQAIQTLSATQTQSIENHNLAVNSYYQNKEVHDQYEAEQRSLHPPLTAEQQEDINKRMQPGRLSTAQFDRSTNLIHWPALLRDAQFSDVRYQIDQLFHNRTPDNSGVDSDTYVQIKQNCEAMDAVLKKRIQELPANTYMAAYHFIQSVEYEARFAEQ